MSSRPSLVVGYPGQDASLLTERLVAEDRSVVCVGRDATRTFGDVVAPSQLSVLDEASLQRALETWQPETIFYLAAHHMPAEGQQRSETPHRDLCLSMDINCRGVLNILEAVRAHSPATRVFYASSSLIFPDGLPGERQNEETKPAPGCVYGLTKLMGQHACAKYRSLGLHCSVGILYNHESALRGPAFLTQRVIRAGLQIRAGRIQPLQLGDLDAVVDWGYAPDYVDAFLRIVALPQPVELIVATGQPHTVRELVAVVFEHLELDWRDHVVEGRHLERARSGRIGDASKLRDLTGWTPTLTFEPMLRRLVDQTAARLAGSF